MTANAMRGDKERYLAGGMDGYISKPIHPDGLFAEIERCLADSRRRQRDDGKSPRTGEQSTALPCWNASRATRNCSSK